MKLWIVLLAVVATAATWAAPVYAGHQLYHATPFSRMSLTQLERYQQRSLRFHQNVVNNWAAMAWMHKPSRFDSGANRPSSWRWCGMLGTAAPRDVCWHEHAIKWVARELAKTKAALVPPIAHLALWRCIAGYPGARPGGGVGESGGSESASNGSHFNILQMTWPWGSGVYYVANPTALSADQIIAKAELGYSENHFSASWLTSQWGQTISPCWQFA